MPLLTSLAPNAPAHFQSKLPRFLHLLALCLSIKPTIGANTVAVVEVKSGALLTIAPSHMGNGTGSLSWAIPPVWETTALGIRLSPRYMTTMLFFRQVCHGLRTVSQTDGITSWYWMKSKFTLFQNPSVNNCPPSDSTYPISSLRSEVLS